MPDTSTTSILSWQADLKDLPRYTGRRLTASEWTTHRSAITAASRKGATLREIATFLGAPPASVHRYIDRDPQAITVETMLRARIDDGTYPLHSQLPTQKEIAKEAGTSPQIADLALDRLAEAGLATRFPGLGAVVTDPDKPPQGPILTVRTRSGKPATRTFPPTPGNATDRVRATVTRRIQDGTYPEGSRIPCHDDLAREFATQTVVITAALKPLRLRRVLKTIRSKGTYVHPEARTLLQHEDPARADRQPFTPAWQASLQDLPRYTRRHLTASEHTAYRTAITAAYDHSATQDQIAQFLGAPVRFVVRHLDNTPEVPEAEATLRTRIVEGTYPMHTLLPKKAELARDLGVRVQTIEIALDLLIEAGLILRFIGLGTVVTGPDSPPQGTYVMVRDRSGEWVKRRIPIPNGGITRQIRTAVTRRIEDGTYREGSRIPTQAVIAEEFATQKVCVSVALKPLKVSNILVGCARPYVHHMARTLLRQQGGSA
ncbi:GntR family transcriptional regulator [Streptomyces griseoviridis]|uniref:GntR family transcriptional regulator n=1 Tax=Streptomyces griseoviridis TaxID=45398 RepID=A0A3Q9KYN4_STRGD|nr:GntR family transcriptional regulator [Streptomyces griseoviridis]AZS87244.1 GntR family transcriptional regulator [Streptomyces griseoviridis]QCN85903.1 hypothetical protein DDJ31_13600 [Streptomyces griseoviridis]